MDVTVMLRPKDISSTSLKMSVTFHLQKLLKAKIKPIKSKKNLRFS